MRIHALNKLISSERIKSFQHEMFHGKYENQAEELPIAKGWFGQDFSTPVRLTRNGWRIPDIFMPAATFVVSAEVRDRLRDLKNIVFRPVQFAKLIDVQYRPGDFSFYRSPEYLRHPFEPDELFDRLRDVPELHQRANRYYELIEPRIKDVIGSFPDAREIEVSVPRDQGQRLQLSEAMVTEYPILWWGYTVLNQEAFERLEPYVDWDYFTQVEIDL